MANSEPTPIYDDAGDQCGQEWGDEDEDFEDCGLADDGQCALAGTEYCDFDCHYRDSDMFAGSAARRRKYGVKYCG